MYKIKTIVEKKKMKLRNEIMGINKIAPLIFHKAQPEIHGCNLACFDEN